MNHPQTHLTYVVAGSKPWNRRIFDEQVTGLPGRWVFVGSPAELNVDSLKSLNPRFIFFLHWSWKVVDEIIRDFECVCFHMTDVPYGRGGSPLQNLILRGHRETKLTALRMEHQLDAGAVYLKERLSLEGNAEEIYIRSTYLAFDMIRQIIKETADPSPQVGEVVSFTRRKPQESELGNMGSLNDLYDFIRMLDAQGYPSAYLYYGRFRFEFRRAALYDGRVLADVSITESETNGE